VLDFDQVQPITMDRAGVTQAVEAARLNDPYLPKPLQATVDEKETWNAFVMVCLCCHYLYSPSATPTPSTPFQSSDVLASLG
jgi:hypothetical protein